MTEEQAVTEKDRRDAAVAAVLARAVRDGQVHLRTVTSPEDWLVPLRRLCEVVCVTAKENYTLEQIERTGITGPGKYVEANIAWAETRTPAKIEIDVHDEVVP